MTLNKAGFGMCLVFLAICTAESRSEQHPLCRALENGERKQQTRFPYAYTCHSNDDDSICTPMNVETTEASERKVSFDEEERGGATWWVYQGRREHVPSAPDDLDDDAWLDCTKYFAQRSPVVGPGKLIADSPGARHDAMSEHITATGGDLGEPGPSAGGDAGTQRISFADEQKYLQMNRRTGTLPLSRGLKALQEHDASGSAGVDINLSPVGGGKENGRINPDKPRASLVYAPKATCDDIWLSWPAMQEAAIARGTFVVFDVITSVGNLFIVFDTLMKFVRLLDLGLVLKWTAFPGFRAAFSPGAINWELDAGQIMQRMDDNESGANATGLHSLEFRNFAMVLSDSQLELLALTLNINETDTQALANKFREELPNRMNLFMSHVMRTPLGKNKTLRTQPCTWSMLLSRSDSMIASLEQYSPWGAVNDESGPRHQTVEYVAWHIRTTDGETASSYNPNVHKYVIQEPSSDVCPTYLLGFEDALQLMKACRASLSVPADDELVYISSNSKSMAKNCTVEASKHEIVMGHVDMGLNSSDAHTAHSKNTLTTALGAFLDFFFMLDSTVIVRTGSSFSGTVCKIKGLKCNKRVYDTLPNRPLFLCLPSDC